MPTPSTIAFYGAYVAGGIGAGMLLEVWINNKIKGVRSRMRLASLTRNTAQQQRIGIAFQRQKQRVRLLSLQKSLGLMLLLFVLLSYWGHFCSAPSMLVARFSLNFEKLVSKGYNSLENKIRKIVDVRDVDGALLLVYEKQEAEGRYICTAHTIKARDLVDKLRSMFPQYNYPKSFNEGGEEDTISSEKLQRLGWSYRPLEETLVD
ncbi:hypothetical protein Gotri_010927 [Gossypium trilobum]|uniref:Uncharacterized protein n=1 Tax=Gossypium trilobum TaxID=34281 RepID=A0A7J9ETN5_9ROSI|nr:hypothetical protein [Gossypium trilobum]